MQHCAGRIGEWWEAHRFISEKYIPYKVKRYTDNEEFREKQLSYTTRSLTRKRWIKVAKDWSWNWYYRLIKPIYIKKFVRLIDEGEGE